MERTIPFRFDISFIEGGLRPTSDPELYAARVKTFYRKTNRNGSYITDSYAEKLAKSAYWKPVFGCYDHVSQDFLGHEGAEKVKAYGIVLPESLAWEDHLDEDGIIRNYAVFDTLIWAEYWEEAKQIISKGQSMEIDPKTIKGSWKFVDGGREELYVYDEGVMAGLCILGDTKTPCFEGAAFFSMDDDCYRKFEMAMKHYFANGGKNAMNVKVAGLEHEKFDALFTALNPNFNEEGSYSLNFIPCEIAEDHMFALACDKAGKVNKYSYSFNEDNAVTVELIEEIDYAANAADFESKFTAATSEFDAYKADSETKLSDAETRFSTLNEQYEALMGEKSQLATQFETLQAEFDALKAQFEEQQNTHATAIADKDSVISQQAEVIVSYEKKEKDTLIQKFAACMPADRIADIVENKDTMSVSELNTALALEYTTFSMAKEQNQELHIPNPAPTVDPEHERLVNILKAYKK